MSIVDALSDREALFRLQLRLDPGLGEGVRAPEMKTESQGDEEHQEDEPKASRPEFSVEGEPPRLGALNGAD